MLGEQSKGCRRIYPDVYYKIQPHVIMACDEMEDYDDCEMPSEEMIREISNQIYENICRMYPEYAEPTPYRGMAYEAAAAYGLTDHIESQQFGGGGIFGDLVTIVLLNELFGRRRRRRRYW